MVRSCELEPQRLTGPGTESPFLDGWGLRAELKWEDLADAERWEFCRARFPDWRVTCYRLAKPKDWPNYRSWGSLQVETPGGLTMGVRILELVEEVDEPLRPERIRAQSGLLLRGKMTGWGIRGRETMSAFLWMCARHWADCREHRWSRSEKPWGSMAATNAPHSPLPEDRRVG